MVAAVDGWEPRLIAAWARAQQRSVVGPGNPAVHLELARKLAGRLEAPSQALDLGSGAGIPGLALAGLWPGSEWVLVDAAQRRVDLMTETVADLGWGERVRVVHGRAEDLAHDPSYRQRFDLVTARSFGPPAATAECAAGFLTPGGILAVTEPPGTDGSRWPASGLAQLGLTALPVQEGLQQLQLTGEVADHFPRRAGVPTRKPLFVG